MTFKTGQLESFGLFSSWPRGNAGNCLLFTTWVLPSVCIYSATTINCWLTNVFCCPFVMMRCAFMRWDHYHEKCKVNIQVDQRAVKMMTQSTEVKMYDHVRYTCVCMRIMGTPRECECTWMWMYLCVCEFWSETSKSTKPYIFKAQTQIICPQAVSIALSPPFVCLLLLYFHVKLLNNFLQSNHAQCRDRYRRERERWLILFYL